MPTVFVRILCIELLISFRNGAKKFTFVSDTDFDMSLQLLPLVLN